MLWTIIKNIQSYTILLNLPKNETNEFLYII